MGSKRKKILDMISWEADHIIKRHANFQDQDAIAKNTDHLAWYLELSRQWAIHHLTSLDQNVGNLLDVGAYYGLMSGVSEAMGWNVWAIDDCIIPDFSAARVSGRKINVSDVCYNACTDALPYPNCFFDVIILSEVIEHLPYSPLRMFREFKRVLKPGGKIQISTPNPAGLGKLIALAMGKAPLEPNIKYFAREDDTFSHKGLTFFKSGREAKLWTVGELEYCLEICGLKLDSFFYYGTTVVLPGFKVSRKITTVLKRFLLPIFGRLPFNGGSLFVIAKNPE